MSPGFPGTPARNDRPGREARSGSFADSRRGNEHEHCRTRTYPADPRSADHLPPYPSGDDGRLGLLGQRFHRTHRQRRQRLLKIVGGEGSHTCVPLQGSGTFAVEAAIGTLVPRDGKVLVLINGAYGKRLAKICEVLQRPFSTFETEENVPTTAADVERLLAADPAISHVALIHCETSTGILNPLEAIAKVVERHGKRLIVDAMSSFGAIGIDARKVPFDALIAASGKCLRASRDGLRLRPQRRPEASAGNCHSRPWTCRTSTPICARPGSGASPRRPMWSPPCTKRSSQYEEGGLPARQWRYASNCETLLGEMARLGFRSFLPAETRRRSSLPSTRRAIRATASPTSTNACGRRASSSIRRLTKVGTFRVGCIGSRRRRGDAAGGRRHRRDAARTGSPRDLN